MPKKVVKKFKILLITSQREEEQKFLNMLKKIKTVEMLPVVASSLAEAKRILAKQSLKAILSTLDLKDSSGIATVKELKKAPRKVPMIIISDSVSEIEENKLFAIGVEEVIDKKKINAIGLWRAISHAYDRHKNRMVIEQEHKALYALVKAIKEERFDAFSEVKEKDLGEYAILLNTLKEQHEKLNHAALYDLMTGLPNRAYFNKMFDTLLANAKRHHHKLAILVIDLDDFKKVNDTLGHQAGDECLKRVSARMTAVLREGDFVARLGGDEFAVILNEIKDEHGAGIAANKLLKVMTKTMDVAGEAVKIGGSIGIATYPSCGDAAQELLNKADIAMYDAKSKGGYRYQLSNQDTHTKHKRRLDIEEGLKHAIQNDKLFLNYQPIIDLMSKKMDGMEVLVRWTHPEFGAISPEEFIPIAEECGLITALGAWVFKQACFEFSRLPKKYQEDFHIAINLSPKQLSDKNLPTIINTALAETHVPRDKLELEITEMAIMLKEEGEEFISILKDFQEMGSSNAIDDFGTGYSSLSRLRKLPISTIKIDRSFVNGISTLGEPSDDEIIVDSIIALADKLNLDIVAEGIETKDQLNYLVDKGCHRGQGYYFSKPVTMDKLKKYIEKSGKHPY